MNTRALNTFLYPTFDIARSLRTLPALALGCLTAPGLTEWRRSVIGLNACVAVFYCLHVVTLANPSFLYGAFADTLFSLKDESLVEYLGYVLECFALYAFLLLSRRDRGWFVWAAIMAIIVLDDSLHGHEAVGDWIEAHSALSSARGELVGFSLLGIPIGLLWIVGLISMQSLSLYLKPYLLFSGYLGLLILFGVFVDALHVWLMYRYTLMDEPFEFLEDGMEQVLITLLALSAMGMARLSEAESQP